jgi:Ca-activated chloride channel family protein
MVATQKAILAAISSATLLVCIALPMAAEEPARLCNQDAMLVFDASGSMSGDGWGYGSESANTVTRIQKVRAALAKVLPGITRYRRVGLITFGPNQCNVRLELKPTEDSASRILSIVDALIPAGQTPLTAAVAEAAEVLDFREKPGLIVLLTDGEETCGGNPCTLGKRLHAEADLLTVHVIGIRVRGYSWMGEQSLLDTECLAEQNGGLYIGVESEDELAKALEKTLGCLMLSDRRLR